MKLMPKFSKSVSRPVKTLMLLLCAVGTAAGGIANAAADNTSSVIVRYDRDSLTTDDGARALYGRLVTAANRVCLDPTTTSVLVRSTGQQQCRDESVSRAVHAINSPRLVALSTGNVDRS